MGGAPKVLPHMHAERSTAVRIVRPVNQDGRVMVVSVIFDLTESLQRNPLQTPWRSWTFDKAGHELGDVQRRDFSSLEHDVPQGGDGDCEIDELMGRQFLMNFRRKVLRDAILMIHTYELKLGTDFLCPFHEHLPDFRGRRRDGEARDSVPHYSRFVVGYVGKRGAEEVLVVKADGRYDGTCSGGVHGGGGVLGSANAALDDGHPHRIPPMLLPIADAANIGEQAPPREVGEGQEGSSRQHLELGQLEVEITRALPGEMHVGIIAVRGDGDYPPVQFPVTDLYALPRVDEVGGGEDARL